MTEEQEFERAWKLYCETHGKDPRNERKKQNFQRRYERDLAKYKHIMKTGGMFIR